MSLSRSKAAGTWERSGFNGRGKIVSKWLDFRWSISRLAHFSKATFFNQNTGPVTPFELGGIGLVALVAIITAITSDKTSSGQMTQKMVLLCVLIALKTNALQFILGVSWERAILFHKSIATVALVCACIHGIPQLASVGSAFASDTKKISGLFMLLCLGLQPLMYILVKPWSFEMFYYSHLVVYFILFIFALIHGAGLVMFSVVAFVVDLLIRYVLTARRTQCTLEHKAGNIVQITFDRRWNYHPGQFVFVMIPSLGVHEWHPFSISSAPHELLISLHVSISGNWTEKLAALAGKEGPVEISAFVEGPYGIPSVNFEDTTYQIAVLISGGVGVTPNQSIANDLLEAHARGRPLKKLMYVWAIKESQLGLLDTMRENGQMPGCNADYSAGSSEGGGSGDVDNPIVTREESESSIHNIIRAEETVLETEIYITSSTDLHKRTINPLYGDTELSVLESSPVDASDAGNSNTSGDKTTLHYKRPDFVVILGCVREMALILNERRVALSVCGPASLVESAVDACRRITSKEVQFDLHVEKFSL